MIVIVKSAPDTPDGLRGIALAKNAGADLVLLQNGVYFAQKNRLGDFSGRMHVLGDDKRLRGLADAELEQAAQIISYDALVDLLSDTDKVIGMF